jgi:uncharacterized membrane protein
VSKTRLEAFSDAVIAILMTIMVLELRPPILNDAGQPVDLTAIGHALPSYVLSFIVVAIYWNNHHHMLHMCTHVNGRILWANMHLLFWLSLVPFVTAWISGPPKTLPWAAYSTVMFLAGISWLLLKLAIIAEQGRESRLKAAYGKDWKGTSSGILTLLAIPLAFLSPYIAIVLNIAVVLTWIVPDRRIESRMRG